MYFHSLHVSVTYGPSSGSSIHIANTQFITVSIPSLLYQKFPIMYTGILIFIIFTDLPTHISEVHMIESHLILYIYVSTIIIDY
jgi:hypothetical protein